MSPISAPANIVDDEKDYVVYTATSKEKPKGEAATTDICYRTYMSSLHETEFLCEPHPDNRDCDGETYLRWMELCQTNLFIPPDVKFYVDQNKNKMHIPGNLYDRHWVYSALCCYRWSSFRKRMVWEAVKLAETPNITFAQVLHYVMTNHHIETGHSFSELTKRDGPYGGNYNNDMARSLVWKPFFQMPIKERQALSGYSTVQTNTIIKRLSTKGTLNVKTLDELVTDKWTPLYELESPTTEKLWDLYQEIGKPAKLAAVA